MRIQAISIAGRVESCCLIQAELHPILPCSTMFYLQKCHVGGLLISCKQQLLVGYLVSLSDGNKWPYPSAEHHLPNMSKLFSRCSMFFLGVSRLADRSPQLCCQKSCVLLRQSQSQYHGQQGKSQEGKANAAPFQRWTRSQTLCDPLWVLNFWQKKNKKLKVNSWIFADWQNQMVLKSILKVPNCHMEIKITCFCCKINLK